MSVRVCKSSRSNGSRNVWMSTKNTKSGGALPSRFCSILSDDSSLLMKQGLHHYDSEIKQQSFKRRPSCSYGRRNSRPKNEQEKVVDTMSWDKESILMTDCFPNGQTAHAKYNSNLLRHLKNELKEKQGQGRRATVSFFFPGQCACSQGVGYFEESRVWMHRSLTLLTRSCTIWLYIALSWYTMQTGEQFPS